MRICAFPAFKNRKLNPYQYLLYNQIVKMGNTVDEFNVKNLIKHKYDIVHVHWPESNKFINNLVVSFFYSIIFNFLLFFAKIRGSKVIWTVHNISPHEFRLRRLLMAHFRIFTKILDGYILLNEVTHSRIMEVYPNLKGKPFEVIPHGHYKGYYRENLSRQHARRVMSFSDDNFVYLVLGQIRKYKGIDILMKAFSSNLDPDIRLIIAGKLVGSSEFKRNILELSAADYRIILIDEFIADNELQVYFKSSDIVILPYLDLFNSGAQLLALSFNKPVALFSGKVSESYRNEFGGYWIRIMESLTSEQLNLIRFSKQNTSSEMPDLTSRDWLILAENTISFYKRICV